MESPALTASSSQKRSAALSMPSGSTPRSNLAEASVRSASRFDVRAIAIGEKYAASRRTRAVDAAISLVAPPITPPIPVAASSASQTRQSLKSSSRPIAR